MVTENNVDELLTKYTAKQFLGKHDFESEFLDYRSKDIVANISKCDFTNQNSLCPYVEILFLK